MSVYVFLEEWYTANETVVLGVQGSRSLDEELPPHSLGNDYPALAADETAVIMPYLLKRAG